MDLMIKDVADLLNVSENTVQRWITEGKIPTYRINEHYYFSRTEVESWVISHKFDATQGSSPFQKDEDPTLSKGGFKQFGLFRSIHKGDVLQDIKGSTKEEIIRRTMKKVAKQLHIDPEVMSELLLDREKMMPTALSNGIAVPHTRDTLLEAHHDVVIVVFLDEPLEYGALDNQPVHTLFFLFACEDKRHLNLLAKIAHLSSQPQNIEFFKTRPSKEEMLAFIKEWETQVTQP
ncbi:MAG: PTS sugar transporter subunit IIA [Parachlamydia sp.]|jgi:PTS system nitrogen regulatory IIA component|nr:PTS sugar transporter subunit IIA [Parachlamydia sp.]